MEKAKKPNAFVRGWKRVTRYFREMKSELKVVWPHPSTGCSQHRRGHSGRVGGRRADLAV